MQCDVSIESSESFRFGHFRRFEQIIDIGVLLEMVL